MNRIGATNVGKIYFAFVALIFSSLLILSTEALGINLGAFQLFEDHREEILAADSIIELSGLAMFRVTVRDTADGNAVQEKATEVLTVLNAHARRLCEERGQRLSVVKPLNFQQVPFQQIYLRDGKHAQVFVFSTEAALLDQTLSSACEGPANS